MMRWFFRILHNMRSQQTAQREKPPPVKPTNKADSPASSPARPKYTHAQPPLLVPRKRRRYGRMR